MMPPLIGFLTGSSGRLHTISSSLLLNT